MKLSIKFALAAMFATAAFLLFSLPVLAQVDPAAVLPPTTSAAWWTALVPLAWIVLTGVVNSIAHYATPQDVDSWAERNPRVAQALSMVRRAGFEPVALVQAVYDFFRGFPPPPGHAAAIGRAGSTLPLSRPAPFPRPVPPP